MELILSYFPDLTSKQVSQYKALGPLYTDWNDKINVISRKDIDHLYEHHVLHSLALAKLKLLAPGMHVLDAGTGGGFPGIPLAIMYPDIQFTLLDSTAKKIHVVNKVSEAIGLENVKGIHSRLEDHTGNYDLVISRAVSTLTQLVAWTKHLVPSRHWLVYKGGSPAEIRKELPPQYDVKSIAVSDFFEEEYFHGKYLVEVRG
jgi:16S rRNA (guanine527-N7)-methyltransferase